MVNEYEILKDAELTEENAILISEWEKSIKALENEVHRLRNENKKLEETVKWMHDLIWDLVKEREDANVDFELSLIHKRHSLERYARGSFLFCFSFYRIIFELFG